MTMPDPEFVRADPLANRAELTALNVEYLSWVFSGIETAFGIAADAVVGMPAAQYVPGVIDKVCGEAPPRGIFYLLRVDGQLAGMGGLRRLPNGEAEIKRIFIRPAFRGMQLGERMLVRLLADAASFGYRAACLDSGPFMQSAQRLYAAQGFVDCAPYDGVEVPAALHERWRFMRRPL